jgi:hypothetical protein
MTSETVSKAIERFKENRVRFVDFCNSLSEEELARPVPDSTYTVKDFASHLGTLDPALTQQVEALAAGRIEPIGAGEDGAPFDIDKFNDALVAERRDWPLSKILDEAAQNREKLLAAMTKLTDEQIEQTMHFTGDNKRPPADIQFKMFLQGLARHDPIHVADMVKALPEHAEDPAIKEWIDDTLVQWYQRTMAGPART